MSPYNQYSGLDYYYTSTQSPPPFLAAFFHHCFLNREWVQADVGVPLNWTGSSPQASNAYRDIGDWPRDSWLDDLALLPNNEIRVSLLYGDLARQSSGRVQKATPMRCMPIFRKSSPMVVAW